MESQIQTDDASPKLHYDVAGTRILAALLDVVVLIALFVFMSMLSGDTGATEQGGTRSVHIYLRNEAFVLYLGLVFAYFFVLEAVFQASLGKLTTGLRVVSSDGGRCGWKQLLLRNLLRFIDWLPVFYVVGIVAIAVSQRRQRLGDIVSDTFVVRS